MKKKKKENQTKCFSWLKHAHAAAKIAFVVHWVSTAATRSYA